MKYFIILFFLNILIFLSCSSRPEEVIEKIHQYEYQRNADQDQFIKWLNSKNLAVRVEAIKALGRIQDPKTMLLVANRLRDENKEVRLAAAFAAGQFFSPEMEKPVSTAISLENDRQVRTRQVEAIGKCGTKNSFLMLSDFVESGIPEYEGAGAVACGIMAYRGMPPVDDVHSLNSLLLIAKKPDVRWRSAYAMYRIASPNSFETFYKSLKDAGPLTRFYDLKGLTVLASILKTPQYQKYGESDVMKEATELAESDDFFNAISQCAKDSSWLVRIANLQLIDALGDAKLLPLIKQGLVDSSAHVRAEALNALASLNSGKGTKLIREYFSRARDWRERGVALMNLAKTDTALAFRLLQPELHRYMWPQNYYCIKTLDLIKAEESTNLLMKLAGDTSLAQSSLAIESLVTRMNVPLAFFLEKLKLHDTAITTIIAANLAFRKDPQTVQPLIDAYRHFEAPKDIEPMEAILTALDSIASKQAVPFLEKELQNPFPKISAAAQQALRHITEIDYPVPSHPAKSLTRYDFPKIDPDSNPHIKFTTTKGDFVLELYPEKAAVTVANFVQLAKSGFYDNIYFHRVVPGFVVQAGDPRGDGWGGPGYTIPSEFNDMFFERGTVGMAHAGKDTGGSQFFITYSPQPHLNGRHTAFGKVYSGMDVVDRLEVYDKILKAEVQY